MISAGQTYLFPGFSGLSVSSAATAGNIIAFTPLAQSVETGLAASQFVSQFSQGDTATAYSARPSLAGAMWNPETPVYAGRSPATAIDQGRFRDVFAMPPEIPADTLENAIPIDWVPRPVIDWARYSARNSLGIRTTKKGFQCVAVDKHGRSFLLRHRSGKFLAIGYDGKKAFSRSFQYFPQLGGMLDGNRLVKTSIIRFTEDVHHISTSNGSEYIFHRNGQDDEWRWLTSGHVPSLGLVVEGVRIFETVLVKPEVLNGYDQSISVFVANRPVGRVKLFTINEGGEINYVRKGFFPQLNLATDRWGIAHIVSTYSIEGSKFFAGLVPEFSEIGESIYDGSGSHDNIRIFTERAPGAFEFATEKEIKALVETLPRLPAIRTEPSPDIRFPGKYSIDRTNAPNNERVIKSYVQTIEVANPSGVRRIEFSIEAANKRQFDRKMAVLKGILEKTPPPLLNGVRRIEIYDHEAPYYGFYDTEAGGVNYGGELIRLFGIKKFTSSDSTLLHHELWHSQHGHIGSAAWQRIILAIKAGGYDEQDAIMDATGSGYCIRSWAEFAAEAGSRLFLSNDKTPPLKAPFIEAALMAALYYSEEKFSQAAGK